MIFNLYVFYGQEIEDMTRKKLSQQEFIPLEMQRKNY